MPFVVVLVTVDRKKTFGLIWNDCFSTFISKKKHKCQETLKPHGVYKYVCICCKRNDGYWSFAKFAGK